MLLPNTYNDVEPLLSSVYLNANCIDDEVNDLKKTIVALTEESEINILLGAIPLLDLTSLSPDDTGSTISKLCCLASSPLPKHISDKYKSQFNGKISTAAVCVYPSKITCAQETLEKLNSTLPIAAVAGGFPSGQYPLKARILQVGMSSSSGANEIDIVIDRSLVLYNEWATLFMEVRDMIRAANEALVKVILSVGECGSYENIYKSSIASMGAGADFIKTSTGKENVNATLPVGIVMCRAIKNYYIQSRRKVGFKPAGGIRSYSDILLWMLLIKKQLGDQWLQPDLFRIGASSVLGSIVDRIVFLDKEIEKKKNKN